MEFKSKMNDFEILEKNVSKAVDLIEKLSLQVEKLQHENEDLKNKLDIESQNAKNSEDNKNLKIDSEEISHLKQKEEVIKHKILQILDKLDSFEKLSNDINKQ